jgi:hypothetical protein
MRNLRTSILAGTRYIERGATEPNMAVKVAERRFGRVTRLPSRSCRLTHADAHFYSFSVEKKEEEKERKKEHKRGIQAE